MKTFIKALLLLLITFPHGVRAEFSFFETFNGYVDGSKASVNGKDYPNAPMHWTDEAYTKIIRAQDAKNYIGLEGSSVINNNRIVSDSIPRAGRNDSMLLFTYRAGVNSWSEQRFAMNQAVLGKKGLDEMWLQYDIFIPSNFKIYDNNPTSGQWMGGGDKVLSLYADKYSHPNTTMIFGQLFARKTPTGQPGYDGHAYNYATLSTYKDGERIYDYFNSGTKRNDKWIDINVDLGTWQRRTVHFKFPTSATANDGALEVWIRRADGSITKIVDKHNTSFYGYDKNYFNAGYLNGWCNDGFLEETNYLVDNFILGDSRSVVDTTAIDEVVKLSPPSNTKMNIRPK